MTHEGVMYSLVAIGFVLIYKASGVFNYAQGSMLLFGALSFVKLTEHGLPFWLALLYAWFPRLKDRRRTRAGLTSGGEQQMVAIGRPDDAA